jgi:hypothetical protein
MSKVLAFLTCLFLWAMFAIGAIFAPGAIDSFWESVRGLPWWFEGPVWFLTLPWMVGLWIWESSFDLWLRFVLVAGVALSNLVGFNPWSSGREPRSRTLTPQAV